MSNELQRMSDEDLACRVQAGSLVCFDELVSRHQDRVFHFLRLKTGQVQDAEDLTQATFIAAYRSIQRYKPRHKFVTWLFAIARRRAISFYRSRRPSEPLHGEGTDARTPDVSMASREAYMEVWSLAREVLPENQVTALWLCYAEDLRQRDIARAMGITLTHVKVLLHRGRRTLADQLRLSVIPVVPHPIPASGAQENVS